MIRIAVSYKDGEIFEHFGHSEYFAIYEYDEHDLDKSVKRLVDTSAMHGHREMADLMKRERIDAVICGCSCSTASSPSPDTAATRTRRRTCSSPASFLPPTAADAPAAAAAAAAATAATRARTPAAAAGAAAAAAERQKKTTLRSGTEGWFCFCAISRCAQRQVRRIRQT